MSNLKATINWDLINEATLRYQRRQARKAVPGRPATAKGTAIPSGEPLKSADESKRSEASERHGG